MLSQPEPGSSADDKQSAGSVHVSSVPSQPEPGGTADLTPEPDFIHIDDPIEDKGKTKKKKKMGPRSKITQEDMIKMDDCLTDLFKNPDFKDQMTAAEEEANLKNAAVTGVNMTFAQMMKQTPLDKCVPYELRGLYRQWLLETFDEITEETLPASKAKVRAGLRLPVPSGLRWEEMIAAKHAKRATKQKELFKDEFLTNRALQAVFQYIKGTQEIRQAYNPD